MRTDSYLEWKVGQNDNHGNKILNIHTIDEKFIIYESNHGLHYDDDNSKDVNYTAKLSAISREIGIVNTLKTKQDKNHVYNMMAIAWRDCFFDNCEEAKNILNSLISTLLSTGKKTYIRWALFTFLISTTFLLLFLHFMQGHYISLSQSIGALIMGGLGALISILIKIKDVLINPHHRPIIILSGFSRILIGSAAGLIFFFAYKANILLSFIQNLTNEQQVYYILLMAFAAGFSERAIPEFINKMNESGLTVKDK